MSTRVQPDFDSITVGPVTARLLQSGPNQASEAVVFIHGNPGSAADFAGLVELVGEHRRAIAFDPVSYTHLTLPTIAGKARAPIQPTAT